jgi:hypothetical protein
MNYTSLKVVRNVLSEKVMFLSKRDKLKLIIEYASVSNKDSLFLRTDTIDEYFVEMLLMNLSENEIKDFIRGIKE